MGGLLMHPVRVKREGSIMPAFTTEQLSDENVMAIGQYLADIAAFTGNLLPLGPPPAEEAAPAE